MADLKLPSEIAQDYLNELKSLKPEVDISTTDNDWFIRSRINGSLVAGVYADQRLIANDAFPQSARHDALGNWLQTLFGDDPVQGNFLPPTQSEGFVGVTGNPGQTIVAGLEFTYPQNGNNYFSTATVNLDAIAGTGALPIQSVAAGQDQNLLSGAILTIPAPPSGLNNTAVASGNISDGRNAETDSEASARILQRLRQALSVGRQTDYQQYAMAADPSVSSASVVRFIFGFGTIGIYITAGTTDIDTAIDNGQPISIIPSPQLIQKVQDYIDANGRVLTDCVSVLSPSELPVNVSVKVKYLQGTGATIPSGQTLTQAQLVTREVQRAIYKTPVGGRILSSASGGFVLASDIEQTIDVKLSDEANIAGQIPILLDRRVEDLSATGTDLLIAGFQAPTPGTITIIEL